ncbi:hypothetical protein KUTG_09964 [Kutzneria sp. 744]|nr:hypothetical protein KUTG_09964 [Kutzneria sp. 744]
MRRPIHHHYSPDEIAQFQQHNAHLLTMAEHALTDPETYAAITDQITAAAPSVTGLRSIDRALLALQTLPVGLSLTDIDTVEGWLARGRRVTRGQQALQMLPAEVDPQHLRARADGTRPTIRMAPVFDISQTSYLHQTTAAPSARPGAPSTTDPRPRPRTGTTDTATPSKELRDMGAALRDRGFTIERTGAIVRADGVASRVFVPSHLTDDQAANAVHRLLAVLDDLNGRAPLAQCATSPAAERSARPAPPAPVTPTASVHKRRSQGAADQTRTAPVAPSPVKPSSPASASAGQLPLPTAATAEAPSSLPGGLRPQVARRRRPHHPLTPADLDPADGPRNLRGRPRRDRGDPRPA